MCDGGEILSLIEKCDQAYQKAKSVLPDVTGNVLDKSVGYRIKSSFVRALVRKLHAAAEESSNESYTQEYHALFELILTALFSEAAQIGFSGEFCAITMLELIKLGLPERIENIALFGRNADNQPIDYSIIVVNRDMPQSRDDDRLAHLHQWGSTNIMIPHLNKPLQRSGNELVVNDIKPTNMTKLEEIKTLLQSFGPMTAKEWIVIKGFLNELMTHVSKKTVKRFMCYNSEYKNVIVPSQLASALTKKLAELIRFAEQKIQEERVLSTASYSAALFTPKKDNGQAQSRAIESEPVREPLKLNSSYSF